MKFARFDIVALVVVMALLSCPGCKPKTAKPVPPPEPEKTEEEIMTERLDAFLEDYVPQASKLEVEASLAAWEAYTTDPEKAEEAFQKAEDAELAYKKFHSNEEMYEEIKAIHDSGAIRDPLKARQVVLIYNDFLENQIPEDLMEKMVSVSTDIQKQFQEHRAEVDGKRLDRNAVKNVLRTSRSTEERKKVWEAHKSIGARISGDVLELVKLRNEAARKLGFTSYWEMSMVLQEHDPDRVTSIFQDLDEQTAEPYAEAKEKMDAALSERLGVKPEDLRPWHYADPFVQEAPTLSEFDLDTLYEDRDLLDIATRYYKSFGLDPAPILANSDVEPREGKSPHAFSFTIDRMKPDVRILLNIQPTDQWMDTSLHELGHAFYDVYYEDDMPWRLREPSHILTTEGVAQLFGEMTKNPNWLREVLDVPEDQMGPVTEAADEARVLQQLVFARWSLVMFNFEKALYTDPGQDLNALWWKMVDKYQMVNPPDERDQPDWATKDHVVVAPVYYHNYVMGQMFKAQILEALAKELGKDNPMEVTFNGNEKAGRFMIEKVFQPGSSMHFLDLTEKITGEPFSAGAYGRSFSWKADPPAAEEGEAAEEETSQDEEG